MFSSRDLYTLKVVGNRREPLKLELFLAAEFLPTQIFFFLIFFVTRTLQRIFDTRDRAFRCYVTPAGAFIVDIYIVAFIYVRADELRHAKKQPADRTAHALTIFSICIRIFLE